MKRGVVWMYRAKPNNGDSLPVPQLVFTRLTDAGEARLQVALYALSHETAGIADTAEALRISQAQAAAALAFWEGAGLLEQAQPAPAASPTPARRRHLNAGEVAQSAQKDDVLRGMLRELQTRLGGIINPRECNIYATLYLQDGFSAELILMATAHCAATGKAAATRVENTLLGWRREGIDNCTDADAYMKTLEERQKRYEAAATHFNRSRPSFDKRTRAIIDRWFEEYGYDWAMVDAARMFAGDKADKIPYINGILQDWYGKGYKSAADVRKRESGAGLQASRKKPAGNDLLKDRTFRPIK